MDAVRPRAGRGHRPGARIAHQQRDTIGDANDERRYALREVFNATRWIVRAGAPWRMLPTNFPPWPAVHQQAQRWITAGCFEDLVHEAKHHVMREELEHHISERTAANEGGGR